MALGSFAPGPYTMTYNAVTVGLVNESGKTLKYQYFGKDMRADLYGLTVIDQVYQGARCFLGPIFFKEWTTANKKIFWPYPQAAPVMGALGTPGTLESDNAKQIVLTVVAGTPAATLGPTTLTAPLAILAKSNDVSVLFGCDERDVPVLFELLPYDSGSGVIKFFALSGGSQ